MPTPTATPKTVAVELRSKTLRIMTTDGTVHEVLVAHALAAPDLLAVCQEIIEHETDDWEARMQTLRAAVAKATA